MPDSKITALTSISTSTDPANDPLVIVDVSDTSMAATGTTKKVTLNQLLGASGTATLASATITGDLTVDTSTLKVDSANNRVGVVTATPRVSLDVASGDIYSSGQITWGGSSPTANQGFLSFTGGNAVIGSTGATALLFYTNGVERLRIDSTGNVGIGGSPTEKLSVNGSLGLQNGGTQRWHISATSGSDLVFTRSSVADRLTITSDGNLGIGVVPSAWASGNKFIDINSSAAFGAFGSSDAMMIGNAYWNGSSWIRKTANNAWRFVIESVSSTPTMTWQLAANGSAGSSITTWTQAMTLDASGQLGIGVAPSATLDVYTSSGDCTAQFKSNAAGSNVISTLDYVSSYGITRIKKSGTTVWETGVIGSTSATPSYSIFNASSIGVYLTSGGTSWTGISDERLKDIIEPISNAVQKVGSLRSVIGKFKNDETNTRRSFLIAQDVQAVLPEAVDASNPDRLGLAYTEVIPLLVAAIKELTARVQTLETR